VNDEQVLTVVTVAYSSGSHLDRFLSSLTVATERPLRVIIADNGSTDGAPEEAVERYPGTRLLHTGGNLGYGTAVNRGVATVPADEEFVLVANPDVVWGPGSIDALLDAARRWPQAGSLGPLIRDPEGAVYPSARHLPSLIRGGMHAVVGFAWKSIRCHRGLRRAVLHVHGGRRPGRPAQPSGLAQCLRARRGDPARQGAFDGP
jgi:N-acetylglucosaminyl-diphospho-decaprenol L-rhamnosyltransferase